MSLQEVLPDKITPLTPDEAARALVEGYRRIFGKRPTVKRLNLLLGQSALETGHWRIIHNFNMGNEKGVSSDRYVQSYSSHDDPTDLGAHYAAFLSPEDGAEHYVRTLTHREHWAKGLESGKPTTFITALSTPPVYFTADPSKYLATFISTYDRYKPYAKTYGASILGSLLGVFIVGGIGWSVYEAFKRG